MSKKSLFQVTIILSFDVFADDQYKFARCIVFLFDLIIYYKILFVAIYDRKRIFLANDNLSPKLYCHFVGSVRFEKYIYIYL